MEVDAKELVRRSCRLLLRPIASVVMKCGMTWKEFSDIAKSVFVQAATEEFGIRGRPTNVSRVSILTGISRKEVKRQRDLLASEEPAASTKTTDATRLLSGWHQDPDYLDDQANPLPLEVSGPLPSFATLFSRYGGDTPEQTLVKELKSANSVAVDDAGRLVAKSRYHMPVAMSEGNIRFFGTNLFDHARTLNKNITGTEEARRFEGFAVDDRIDPAAAEEFKTLIEERGQQFLEDLDRWLDQHRATDPEQVTEHIRLGVGLYAIEGQLPKG